jgi:O-antigen/teichoic acid export membrane protein
VGYPPLAMVYLPRYYALGRGKLVVAFQQAYWRDGVVMTAILALLVALAVFATPIDSGLKTALIFGLISIPGSALLRFNSAIANSLRRFTLSYVPDFLYRPSLLLVYLLAAWFLGLKLSVNSVLWAFVIAAALVALGQAWLIGKQGAIPPPFRPLTRNMAPLLRGRAGALVIVAVVSTSFADLVNMIGGLYLPAHDVALLGVSIRLAALIGFITQATQNFILPDLVGALTRGDRQGVRELLLRINVVALSAIGLAILAAAAFGQFVLRIFGPDYEAAHWPLVLFMMSQALRAASGMNQHLLSLGGFQARTASSCLFAVSMLAATASLLAPRYGVIGMGWAVLIADLIWALLLAVQAQRYAGRRGDIAALLWSTP